MATSLDGTHGTHPAESYHFSSVITKIKAYFNNQQPNLAQGKEDTFGYKSSIPDTRLHLQTCFKCSQIFSVLHQIDRERRLSVSHAEDLTPCPHCSVERLFREKKVLEDGSFATCTFPDPERPDFHEHTCVKCEKTYVHEHKGRGESRPELNHVEDPMQCPHCGLGRSLNPRRPAVSFKSRDGKVLEG